MRGRRYARVPGGSDEGKETDEPVEFYGTIPPRGGGTDGSAPSEAEGASRRSERSVRSDGSAEILGSKRGGAPRYARRRGGGPRRTSRAEEEEDADADDAPDPRDGTGGGRLGGIRASLPRRGGFPRRLREIPSRRSDLSGGDASSLCREDDVAKVIVSRMCAPPADPPQEIRIHLCDAMTGRPIWRQENNQPHGGRTSRRGNTSGLAADILVLESYADLLAPDAVLLLEILAPGSGPRGAPPRPSAWAFLRPRGRRGQIHVGHRGDAGDAVVDDAERDEWLDGCCRTCRLQLFKYRRSTWLIKQEARRRSLTGSCAKSEPPPVFLQFLRNKRKPLPSTVDVTVGPVARLRRSHQSDGESREVPLKSPLEPMTRHNDLRLKRGPTDPCLLPTDIECCLHGDSSAQSIQFSHSGGILTVAVENSNLTSSILFYDTNTWKILYEIAPAHNGPINEMGWSKDDTFVMSASADSSAKVWRCCTEIEEEMSFKRGKVLRAASWVLISTLMICPITSVHSAVFLLTSEMQPSRPFVITGAGDCTLKLWDAETEKDLGLLGDRMVHESCVNAVTADETGRVFSGDAGGCIVIWMPTGGRVTDGSDFTVLRQLDGLKHAYGKDIRGLALNPSRPTGKSQLLIKQKNALFIFDCASQRVSHVLHSGSGNNHVNGGKEATFSPDGRYVLAASDATDNNGIGIWDAASGQKIQKLSNDLCPVRSVNAVCWHPSQHVVALSLCGKNAVTLIVCTSAAPVPKVGEKKATQ